VAKLRQNREGDIMKNEISSVLLDEKIGFVRLHPHTLDNFWQVINTVS
jgi:hypothetical protein